MSLRLKTIFGVAVIEAVLLVILITTVLDFMRSDSEAALKQRAETAAALFATTTKDAVLSFDLASLEAFTAEMMKNPGLVYARVLGSDGIVFASGGDPAALDRSFVADTSLDSVKDGVFDQFSEISAGGVVYGRVEIGISTDSIIEAIASARKMAGSIALAEMLLVALFSYFLGTFLTHQLSALSKGAKRISEGRLDVAFRVKGNDEVTSVGRALNVMVENLVVARKRRDEYELQLQELNKTLERRVAKRTISLEEKNSELTAAYDTIKSAQAQLLQSEKMASVGQLAAGVAHEINNPVGFINSNLGTLEEYVSIYQKLLRHYEELATESSETAREQKIEFITSLKREEGLSFVNDDISSLLTDSIEGARRVREIVQGMKNFSRADGMERESVDVNACIVSALKMAANELKYKCQVRTELEDIPAITGNSGQIVQVVLNLIVNASQAIVSDGEITVRSTVKGNNVQIDIEDNGCGISQENMDKLFEPFFTTKGVGEGTGLGLSIVYGIVKDHEGGVVVSSEQGQGSIFTITIPHELSDETKKAA